MGNTSSEVFEHNTTATDPWWPANQTLNRTAAITEDISAIRERRLNLIATKKKEMDDLRKENEELKLLLKQKNDSFEVPGTQYQDRLERVKEKEEMLHSKIEELQRNLEEAKSIFDSEREEYKKHVIALKDVIAVSKQLVLIRDEENKQLTSKVAEIQSHLSQKELEALSNDLREEYERQLKSMKQLKNVYEEKQRVDRDENRRIKSELDDANLVIKAHETKNKELGERVDELEQNNSEKYDSIRTLESQLGFSKAECAEVRAEMAVINQLFSQILLGFNNSPEVDLDNLIKRLEENHDLLTDIVVNEECTAMSSALPKVLLDLIHQVNEKNKPESNPEIDEIDTQNTPQQNTISSAAEIVENLPKVWRVLIELLSHQTTLKNENNEECDKNPCYKSVETPTGPTLVLSVSKTFIRLKDLIVEKKSLEKETTRLKQLNTHLEVRLQDQEKRLGEVSHELANTWNVVGKMQKQHQQLHTHEKILRYELSQKRKLLNELKAELEYCREKCLLAHEKNSSTEELWKQLRSDFASRKVPIINEDVNNSMESGYSDDRESSSDDDYDTSPNPTILEVIKGEIVNIECGTSDAPPESSALLSNINSEAETANDGEIANLSNLDDSETKKHRDIDDTYKKLEQDILQTIKRTKSGDDCAINQGASTSKIDVAEPPLTITKTREEILAGREERLRRLEEEAQQLVGKVLKNSNRGTAICNTLTMLHDKYGSTSGATEEIPSDNDKDKNETKDDTLQ